MPFCWVRVVDVRGEWGAGPVELRLRASCLSSVVYAALTLITGLVLLLPVTAAAQAAAHVGHLSVGMGARLFVAGVIGLVALTWFAYAAYRSARLSPRVRIDGGQVEIERPGLFTTARHVTPLRAFEGLAVLPHSTLSGKVFGVFLIHPDRSLSPLLMTGHTIEPQHVRDIAAALQLPVLGDVQATAANDQGVGAQGVSMAA